LSRISLFVKLAVHLSVAVVLLSLLFVVAAVWRRCIHNHRNTHKLYS